MRLVDVFGLALSALWQQRVRTLLTTLGVIGGSFVLITSLSIGQGIQETIMREYNRHVDLRRIDVRAAADRNVAPPEQEILVTGPMSAGKRQRLQDEKKRRWQMTRPNAQRVPITREKLRSLEQIEHVERVSPFVYQWGRMHFRQRSVPINLTGAPFDHPVLSPRLVAGKPLAEGGPDAVLISEYTLYQLGITDEADIDKVIGQPLVVKIGGDGSSGTPDLMLGLLGVSGVDLTVDEERLMRRLRKEVPDLLRKVELSPEEEITLQKMLQRPARDPGPNKSKSKPIEVTFTVCGVLRCGLAEDSVRPGMFRTWAIDNSDLVIADRRAEQLFFDMYPGGDQGLDTVVVEVDNIDNVRAVNAEIKALGLDTWCVMERLETERFVYLLLSAAMTLIALVALGVAALGITNTMRMSVLERTREIGIMKAVGARDIHLLLIFLIEGALIGLTGSVIGLVLSWAVSFPADAWVKSYVAKRIEVDLKDSIFSFPWWLLVGAPLLVTLITTVAAVLPARKAARVNPITALRHD